MNKTLVAFTLIQITIRMHTTCNTKCFARCCKIAVIMMSMLEQVIHTAWELINKQNDFRIFRQFELYGDS